MTEVKMGQYADASQFLHQDEGWVVKCIDAHDRTKDVLVRSYPSIIGICEPLTGVSVLDRETGVRSVRYPTALTCLRIYARAVDILRRTGDREGIFTLALHRQYVIGDPDNPYVAVTDTVLDEAFLECMLAAQPALSSTEWRDIAVRMPEGSRIQAKCSLQLLDASPPSAASG